MDDLSVRIIDKKAGTVGELIEMLKLIPADYSLSVIGTDFGIAVDDRNKLVLFDEVDFIDALLEE